MKRIIIVSLALVMALTVSLFAVNAEDATNYALIPEDANWVNNDNGGTSVKLEFVDGNAIFSGSAAGTWPDIACTYPLEDQQSFNIDEYSLYYNFTVDTGNTNISLRFVNADGMTYSFPIANTSIEVNNYDPGSGDLAPDTYKGVVKLSDFVEGKALLDNSAFDKTYINADNELTFSGIQVYSVHGATITVYALEVVPNGFVPEDNGDESSEAESEDESDVVSEDESDEVSEDSKNNELSEDSISENENVSDGEDNVDEEKNNDWILWAAIGAAVVVVAIVVVIVIKKKK